MVIEVHTNVVINLNDFFGGGGICPPGGEKWVEVGKKCVIITTVGVWGRKEHLTKNARSSLTPNPSNSAELVSKLGRRGSISKNIRNLGVPSAPVRVILF